MTSFTSNIIVNSSPKEIIHGEQKTITNITSITVINPVAGAWICKIYYTRGTVRTTVVNEILTTGDTIINTNLYRLLYGENLEIETSNLVEVTFNLDRYPL